MINPDASLIVAPAIALLALRSASLVHHLHTAVRIRRAKVSASVIGRAGDRLPSAVGPVSVITPTVRNEVCPAAVIDPDAPLIVAPAISLLAARSAALVNHLHATARVRLTIMPTAVVG